MRNLIKVIGIRVSEDLYKQLKTISDARGEDVSDFVRRAILKELANLNYLSNNQKKALGIKPQDFDEARELQFVCGDGD